MDSPLAHLLIQRMDLVHDCSVTCISNTFASRTSSDTLTIGRTHYPSPDLNLLGVILIIFVIEIWVISRISMPVNDIHAFSSNTETHSVHRSTSTLSTRLEINLVSEQTPTSSESFAFSPILK
jgi:hypothetical protein